MFYYFDIRVVLGVERSPRPYRTQNIPVSKLHGMIYGRNEDAIQLKNISKSILSFGSIYFEEFHANKGH